MILRLGFVFAASVAGGALLGAGAALAACQLMRQRGRAADHPPPAASDHAPPPAPMAPPDPDPAVGV